MKSLKKSSILFCFFILFGCASNSAVERQPQEVVVKLQAVEPTQIMADVVNKSDEVNRSMDIPYQEGYLSGMSFICGDKAFIKLFSGLTISDVTKFWNDIVVLENTTSVRHIELYINSPGGDAFSGMALADEIERAQRKGFTIVAHASGIVASAAIPVLAVCGTRIAAPGTIFMVHEAALFKFFIRETASDIIAQNQLMDLLKERYLSTLERTTTLSKDKWEEMEKKTTWFSAEKALGWGLVDKIE